MGYAVASVCVFALPSSALTERPPTWSPPMHDGEWPPLVFGNSESEQQDNLDRGPHFESGRSAQALLEQHRKLDNMLAALQPGRPGQVDAFVIAIALDSDPVFGREIREAGRVLERRYDAAGRTLVLAGSDGNAPSDLPRGNPQSFAIALARVGELMAPEDVLLLYLAAHGADFGIAYHDGNEGFGIISPMRLKALLDDADIRNRLLIINACYSGVFVPVLGDANSIVATAASSTQPSFGCVAENDWTFFGDALINRALRKPQPFTAAAKQAKAIIGAWESAVGEKYSQPQLRVGKKASAWLGALEKNLPQSVMPSVGRPALDAFARDNNRASSRAH